jgi:hypothetical protein
VPIERRIGARSLRSLDEQRHGIAMVLAQRKSRHGEHAFERRPHSHATGRHDHQRRAAFQEAGNTVAHGVEDMLAVVQQDHGIAARKGRHDRLRKRSTQRRGDTGGSRHGTDDHHRVAHVDEIDEAAPIAAGGCELLDDTQRESCLAHATRAADRDHAVLIQRRAQRGALSGPPHKAAGRRRPGRSGLPTVAIGQRRVARQCAAIRNLQLLDQRRYVRLDRAHRQVQAIGDLPIRQVRGHQRPHLAFTRGDPCSRGQYARHVASMVQPEARSASVTDEIP